MAWALVSRNSSPSTVEGRRTETSAHSGAAASGAGSIGTLALLQAVRSTMDAAVASAAEPIRESEREVRDICSQAIVNGCLLSPTKPPAAPPLPH
ncbi:hypothetical protein ACFPRL_08745 [Pseudoclavibacter helvolus]